MKEKNDEKLIEKSEALGRPRGIRVFAVVSLDCAGPQWSDSQGMPALPAGAGKRRETRKSKKEDSSPRAAVQRPEVAHGNPGRGTRGVVTPRLRSTRPATPTDLSGGGGLFYGFVLFSILTHSLLRRNHWHNAGESRTCESNMAFHISRTENKGPLFLKENR